MKKQKKQFVVVCVVLLVCVIAYLAVLGYNKRQAEKEAEEADASIAVLNVDVDYLQSFSYLVDGFELSFAKDGDDWYYTGNESLNIDNDAIATLLSYVETVSAESSFTDYEDLSEYGFDDPANTITLSTSSADIVIHIGDYNTMTGQYYLYVEGDTTVYLTDSTLKTQFSTALDDLIAEEEETETEDTQNSAAETVDGTEAVESTETE